MKNTLLFAAGKLLLKMLGAVAEMERDLLVERTHAGLARAKAEGKTLGRTPKTTPEQREAMKAEYNDGRARSSLFFTASGILHKLAQWFRRLF